jgi:hypothetical protein
MIAEQAILGILFIYSGPIRLGQPPMRRLTERLPSLWLISELRI